MEKKGAANCKYARPTLQEPHPLWLDAENSPWTCERDEQARVLDSTEVCEDCPRWESRQPTDPPYTDSK